MSSKKQEQHFLRLQNMYLSAPINKIFQPTIAISHGEAVVEMDLSPRYHHAAGALHGAIYFKMLDDAAFFAANSLEQEVFVLTTSFTTYLTRPVSEGKLRSIGRVVNQNRSQIIAEAVVYDAHDREIGRGSGILVRSKRPLAQVDGYVLPGDPKLDVSK
ncbi:MAG: PaaI family thioesterase [Candidatus Promineifilaceae bacterium]|nr:PaaI family thioesterase [Candidatus Promineifilaceae bacterium]